VNISHLLFKFVTVISFFQIFCIGFVHGKNDFAEGSKILLDTNLKIILLNYQNNFVGILKIMSKAAKNFDILAIALSVLHNYLHNSTKFYQPTILF